MSDAQHPPYYKPPPDPNEMACDVLKKLIANIENGLVSVEYFSVSNGPESAIAQEWRIKTVHSAFKTTAR